MSTQESGYNGWTNYETWAVVLTMDNEQESYKHARAMVRKVIQQVETRGPSSEVWTPEQSERFELAEALKDWHEQRNPLAESNDLWSMLLGAALSEVNWDEIASNLLEEVKQEV